MKPASVFPILLAVLLTSPSHAAFNDKKAIANSAGSYKGKWQNKSTFGGNPFSSMDGQGRTKIPGKIRLPRNPKKINFRLPFSVHNAPTVVRFRVVKTIVRRGGKVIIHKGKNSIDLSPIGFAGEEMKGDASATLKARGRKFVGSGKIGGKNTADTPLGPERNSGKFSGKGR